MRFYNLFRQGARWPSGWLYRLLLPVLLPFLVIGIGVLLYVPAREFWFCLAPLDVLPIEQVPSTEKIVQAIEIRFAWTTAQLILATTMLVTIAVAIVTILRTFGGVLLVAVGSISLVIGVLFSITHRNHEFVIMPFASELFCAVECVGEYWFGGDMFGGDIDSWIYMPVNTEALFFPFLILVWLAFSGLLWPARRLRQNGSVKQLNIDDLIDDLKVRRQLALTLLNCSAVVLVSFLIEFYTILKWPVVAFAKPEPVIAMASGVTALIGVFFTLILAAIAIPVILNMSGQAREYAVAKGFTTHSDISSSLHENRFGFSRWWRVSEVFAVIGPSIVGVVGPLIVEVFR